MGVVDRTDEFRQIVRVIAAQGGISGVDKFEVAPHQQSELNVWSAEIGSKIHESSMKVQELRKMARSKGIYNDQTSDINRLTASVNQDITMLNQKIEALEAKAKGSGPNKTHQAHTSHMVNALKTRLLEVTKDFKDALEDRTKTLEQQDNRRKMYSMQPRPIGNLDDPEGGPALGTGMQAMAVQHAASRAEAVQSVQKMIGEVAQIFQKVAVMVTAQEEMIQRIDHDMDDTLSNVHEGQDHLLKYFHNISSNRTLIIKVFMILLFFVIFFIVFLA